MADTQPHTTLTAHKRTMTRTTAKVKNSCSNRQNPTLKQRLRSSHCRVQTRCKARTYQRNARLNNPSTAGLTQFQNTTGMRVGGERKPSPARNALLALVALIAWTESGQRRDKYNSNGHINRYLNSVIMYSLKGRPVNLKESK